VQYCALKNRKYTPGTQSNLHGSHEASLYILPLDAWLVSLLVDFTYSYIALLFSSSFTVNVYKFVGPCILLMRVWVLVYTCSKLWL